jgi:LmbE family N-acetylglucosaminyl deacetylase
MSKPASEVLAGMAALPFAGLDAILQPGACLILSPHPDDESLGCGGLIAEACTQGRSVHVLEVTDGTGSHPNSRAWPAPRLKAQREQEACAAVAVLGLSEDRIGFLGLRDGAAPHDGPEFDAAVSRIAEHASARAVTTILATWEHDPHADHVAVSRMARAVAARIGARLLFYPVWGWTLPVDHALPDEPLTGWRLDIARHLPAKRQAIAAHVSQTTDLIADDPEGFRLQPEFVALFTRPFEVFLQG